jgi:hypothetical protein
MATTFLPRMLSHALVAKFVDLEYEADNLIKASFLQSPSRAGFPTSKRRCSRRALDSSHAFSAMRLIPSFHCEEALKDSENTKLLGSQGRCDKLRARGNESTFDKL